MSSTPSNAINAGGRSRKKPKSGFWKRQARTWHWVSGAICLIGIILFAVTGITLNHAHQIKTEPSEVEKTMTLSSVVVAAMEDLPTEGTSNELARPVARALERELSVNLKGREVEWTDVDAYISLPRPGGDAWVSIDRASGEVLYVSTSRGAVAYLNDLHKGRNTGAAWRWFLDIFSAACIVFALSGLWLLQIHAGKRSSTWPLVAGGLLIPVILLILFVHR
ncbi:PepSY-associated TM helix domain-containing protein [Parvularcula sp. LCG005]|uniref:PepSY-associated TM helix domain-containing protein n=1 Tax=Parvularcula sp. LCG005 TaxID=3078805 RepID=UPI002941E73E|nr:PepSY-associated TM helix domain-containing protein [Parvularcula sp. LCG005]WOI52342.1 PepSY-associated TM helix domain-containing protein [Parvularcula sp. LCG005]